MINEVAPSPHTSGPLTIEACEPSQFQQHVRAVCNLPLGSTAMRCSGAAMATLLGDLWGHDGKPPAWDRALTHAGVNLHLYGKRLARPGRKMGHLTVTHDSLERARRIVVEARECLQPPGT